MPRPLGIRGHQPRGGRVCHFSRAASVLFPRKCSQRENPRAEAKRQGFFFLCWCKG